MTPPEHLLAGITTANLYYAFFAIIRRHKTGYGEYLKLVFLMGLMAVLPDIDSFFGHYTSKDPLIGHRGMTHSFLGVAVMGLVLLLLFLAFNLILRLFTAYWHFLHNRVRTKNGELESKFSFLKYWLVPLDSFLLLFSGIFLAGTSHLIADLPQPASVWGGIPLFFPLKANGSYLRNGGWGIVGWYDLVSLWVLLASVSFSLVLVSIGKLFLKIRHRIATGTGILLLLMVMAVNGWSLGFVTQKYARSTYQGDMKWYKSQLREIDKCPQLIRDFTRQGVRVFVSLFNQVQRLSR